MYTEEELRMAQQLMAMNPGLSPADAMATVKGMSPGEMVQESTAGVAPAPQGGLLGPGAPTTPAPEVSPQQPQQPPKSMAQLCIESGGKPGPDGMCHYVFNY